MLTSFRRRDKKPEESSTLKQDSPESLESKLRPRRKLAGLGASLKLFTMLLALWVIVIHYFERIRVKNAVNACQWDKWENWKGEKAGVKPHRIVLLADPQLVDDHTYPTLPRLANYVIQKMSDNYLYINYKYMQAYLDPDTTIFVGDLFDGGRDWDDEVWFEEFKRFNSIFPRKPNRRSFRSLPGNHDIGFQNISYHNLRRFSSFFGELNDAFELGNHTFVQLDTISLSHEDEEFNQEPDTFCNSIDTISNPMLPRILLSHVPLYRDPNVEVCGPGRESKKRFPLQRGFQYQTVIDYYVTQKVLDKIKPILIFSGDDHDYCDTVHIDYLDNSKKLAREISCKTPSMTNGIKYPAYHLLSLNNPYDPHPKSALLDDNEKKTYETMMCYLPNPYRAVKVYSFCLLLLFAILFAFIVHPEKVEHWIGETRPQILPQTIQSFVKPDHSQDLRTRRLSCLVHCGALLACLLALISLYYRA